jgi:general stress protein 26
MGRIPYDTNELKEEIIGILEREKHIVLASCSDGRVTARTVSHVNAGLDIYLQTDKKFLKVEQIAKNPRVALCVGNLQIEGVAEFERHPSDPENAEFCSLYKQKHPQSFEMYSSMKNEIVIKVKPALAILWKYIDGKPCRDYLHVDENIAYREYYDTDAK